MYTVGVIKKCIFPFCRPTGSHFIKYGRKTDRPFLLHSGGFSCPSPFHSFPFHSISARMHKLPTAHTHRLFICLLLHASLCFLVSTPSSSAIKLTHNITTRRNARYSVCHSPSIVHRITISPAESSTFCLHGQR